MPAKKGRQRAAAKTNSKKAKQAATKQQTRESIVARVRIDKLSADALGAPLTSRVAGRIADLGRVWAGLDLLKQEFRLSFARPDDFLVCDLIFENLHLDPQQRDKPALIRKDENAAATLIVEFPPQSFGEEVFLDRTGADAPPANDTRDKFPERVPRSEIDNGKVKPKNDVKGVDPDPLNLPVRIRMAGPSRVAFSMPADELSLNLSIEAILDACRRWPMRLSVNAIADPPRRFEFSAHEHLAGIITSASWAQAKDTLVNAVGVPHQRSLTGAGRRIAQKAIEIMRSSNRDRAENVLREAMNEELDVLAARSAPLRDAGRRRVAAAAISMAATEALANYKLNDPVFDLGRALPFLPIIFGPHEPAKNITALELPYRLITSPVPNATWHHPTEPVARNGRIELWHTRLAGTQRDIGPDGTTNIRALWSPDYHIPGIVGLANGNLPFLMSLDPLDREMLVKLMCGFDEETISGSTYRPKATKVNRLSLSSLGALLDSEGNWPPPAPAGVSLEQWVHRATLGRDHYVKVVYRGFLKEFGHAASLVKVTERKFENLPDNSGRVAVLRQKFFIVVREHIRQYNGAGDIHKGRCFPFKTVEITTCTTPTLLAPNNAACKLKDGEAKGVYADPNGVPSRACFWPMINPQNNFMFHILATDLSGKVHSFKMPLLFVGIEANQKTDLMKTIIELNNKEDPPRRVAALNGASVAFAPKLIGAKGDTSFPTHNMVFKAGEVNGISKEEPQFYPELEASETENSAIQRLLQKPNVKFWVEYPTTYLANGFAGANQGEVFLKLKTALPLAFGGSVKSDAIGGLATPSMEILGLSRIMGPVASSAPAGDIEAKLDNVINNTFDPTDFFKGASILGGIKLSDILTVITSGLGGDNVPKLLSRELPDRVEASFDWVTQDFKDDVAKGLFVRDAGGTTKLTMRGVVSAPIKTPNAPTFSAVASLVNFKINLFGFVTVWFDELSFNAKTGTKPDVAVKLHPGDQMVEFGGPLEFVNTLRSIIPSNGFSDPPGITVTPSGISASYSINVPSLAVGIFALEHVSLGAGFLLPFDAKPAEVRFNFSERQRPFSLTVSLLGGGGFFAICVGTEGVREIEAAIEFGAALSINLGVASGSVEVKAGVYFHWKTESVELAGYVRLHGELSVLGLISASLTFNLQLAYLKEGGRSVVWGEATLEVEIEILFLSFSVSVSCRREFGGSDSDPKFAQLITNQATWDRYCEAFALEA
jgi:hypothetical protein